MPFQGGLGFFAKGIALCDCHKPVGFLFCGGALWTALNGHVETPDLPWPNQHGG